MSACSTGKRKRIPVREEVRYVLIGLLAFEREGIHAYELDRRLRVLSEELWTPYSGEVSRTLHQLEEDGDISSQWNLDDGRPKRVFTATAGGLDHVDEWLRTEITAEPRPLHDKWWHRFVAHRARKREPAELARDIHIRRTACLEQLRRLEERLAAIAGTDAWAPFARISLRMQQFEWQAELGILDELQRELTSDGRTDLMTKADEARDAREENGGRRASSPRRRASALG